VAVAIASNYIIPAQLRINAAQKKATAAGKPGQAGSIDNVTPAWDTSLLSIWGLAPCPQHTRESHLLREGPKSNNLSLRYSIFELSLHRTFLHHEANGQNSKLPIPINDIRSPVELRHRNSLQLDSFDARVT